MVVAVWGLATLFCQLLESREAENLINALSEICDVEQVEASGTNKISKTRPIDDDHAMMRAALEVEVSLIN